MAKAKPSRKFKYGLHAVLKVRGIKEKKEQEKFAEKHRSYLTEKEKEDEIVSNKRTKEDELRGVFKGGRIDDFTQVLRRKDHLGVLKEDLDQQVEKVIDASQKLEEQRVHLIQAMKDKKIMEKDKEHKLKQYKDMMEKLEIKFMDEIATQRFSRRKKD